MFPTCWIVRLYWTIFKLSKFKEFNSHNQNATGQSEQYADEGYPGYLKIIFVFGDTILAKLTSFFAIHLLIVVLIHCILERPKYVFYKRCIAIYLLPVIARYLEVSPACLEVS